MIAGALVVVGVLGASTALVTAGLLFGGVCMVGVFWPSSWRTTILRVQASLAPGRPALRLKPHGHGRHYPVFDLLTLGGVVGQMVTFGTVLAAEAWASHVAGSTGAPGVPRSRTRRPFTVTHTPDGCQARQTFERHSPRLLVAVRGGIW